MGNYTQCVDCGSRFWADFEWKKRCYRCYIAYARDRDERQERRRNNWKHQRPARPAPSLHIVVEPDKDGDWLRANIKTLIRLCHPDRHDGSKVSNEITAHLLSRYREVRRASR